MLSKSDKELLKARGIDIDALIKAHSAPTETAITLGEIKGFYSESEIDEIKTNVKTAHEKNYPEIFGRQMNKDHELGLSANDAKDVSKVIAAFESKVTAKVQGNPDARVAELEKSLKKLQEGTIPELEGKAKEWEGKFKEVETFNIYSSAIPENANKYLTKEEHVARVRKAVAVGENGIAVNPATGEPYKDKKEKPIAFKDKVAELYTTNETWINPAETAPKAPFHHSTNAPNGGNGKGRFDYDKTIADLSQQYDRQTPEGRQAFQAALTAAQVNAAQN